MRLRPSDPYCHPLYASRRRGTKLLLLRLSRPSARRQGGEREEDAAQLHTGDSCDSESMAVDMAGGAAGAPPPPWRAEVVACMEARYSFSTPADYAYLRLPQQATRAAAAAAEAAAALASEQAAGHAVAAAVQGDSREPPGLAPEPLMCLPPIFAKTPVFDYAFKQHRGEEGKVGGGWIRGTWAMQGRGAGSRRGCGGVLLGPPCCSCAAC